VLSGFLPTIRLPGVARQIRKAQLMALPWASFQVSGLTTSASSLFFRQLVCPHFMLFADGATLSMRVKPICGSVPLDQCLLPE
jgi:hypothetical protein